jgi:hypothetical protein
MSFNKISRARNLLNEAQLSVGCIHLNPTLHADELKMLVDIHQLIEKAMALLDAKKEERK